MNVPVLKNLVHLIEEIFKADAPVIVQTAETVAIAGVESDPKVAAITAASVAFLSATQNLKAAIHAEPEAAAAAPAPEPPAAA